MNDFLPMITSALAGASAAGAFKGPVQTLQDIWYVTYGQPWSEKAEKIKEQQKINTQKFAESISNEILKLPPENIQYPKLNIIGPALDASKFYIEDEELRNMFSKLLASSMDSSKNNYTHNSFVEIIKQLSSLDAENLSILYQEDSSFPIVNINAPIKDNNSYKSIISNYFMENLRTIDENKLNSSSVKNLQRLGLIEISYNEYISDDSIYRKFEESSLFLKLKQTIQFTNLPQSPLANENQYLLGLEAPYIQKGLIKMTQFGNDFCLVCID